MQESGGSPSRTRTDWFPVAAAVLAASAALIAIQAALGSGFTWPDATAILGLAGAAVLLVVASGRLRRDRSAGRESESALKESATRLRLAVEQMPAVLWTVDRDLRITSSIGGGLAGLGLKPGQVVGMALTDYLGTNDPGSVALDAHQGALAGRKTSYEMAFGGCEWQVHVEPLVAPGGEVEGAIGVGIDVTGRVLAERERARAEDAWKSLFAESKDAVFISTPEGRFVEVNPAMVDLLGYGSREELLAADIARDVYRDPADRDALVREIRERGFVRDHELELRRKSGATVVVLESATAVRDGRGNTTALRGILHDITERRRLETRLRHAQRMETIGTLAGGIAHDFNNLLTVILGGAAFAREKLRVGDPALHPLEQVDAAVEQARRLTDQLLGLSRRQSLPPRPLDLDVAVRDVVRLLGRVLGEDIRLETELLARPGRILGDAGQIQQILMNLCTNARDAMPRGGTIRIRTRHVPAADGNGRGTIDLVVSDDGVGMDPALRDRIFEPFFTTKEDGRGTGLGLWVVYSIVQQHGGRIEVETAPALGTAFHIAFPAAAAASVETAARPPESPGGRGERILLAEDDDAVRQMAANILGSLGYAVVVARSGEEAVDLVQRGAAADLAVLDVVMPGMSGPEAYRRLRSLLPALPALFVTGYDRRSELEPVLRESGALATHLPKPYSGANLAARVREMLDMARAAPGGIVSAGAAGRAGDPPPRI